MVFSEGIRANTAVSAKRVLILVVLDGVLGVNSEE